MFIFYFLVCRIFFDLVKNEIEYVSVEKKEKVKKGGRGLEYKDGIFTVIIDRKRACIDEIAVERLGIVMYTTFNMQCSRTGSNNLLPSVIVLPEKYFDF